MSLAWIAVLLVGAVVLAGCGSGGDATAPVEAGPSGNPEGSGATPGTEPVEKSGASQRATARSDESHRSNDSASGEPGPPPSAPERGGSEAVRAADRAAVRGCIARFGRSACEEMVREAGAPATRVDEPSDCLKAMSKARCEEMAAAQRAGEEHGDSVNLEECIENPTPKCEAVLRPLLEAQRGH